MSKVPTLLISLDSIRKDPALGAEGRGERKILVTELYSRTEVEATCVNWEAGNASAPTPVQVMADVEMAVFTHRASQASHLHKLGTEIYMVLEGRMIIEVEGVEYTLKAGDTIVVNPGAFHKVIPRGNEFLCKVITINCGGTRDKYEHRSGYE